MTPEAQRIAIAEACGAWTFVPEHDYVVIKDDGETVMRYFPGEPKSIKARLTVAGVPDYLNDLNACHEAEATLTCAQREEMTRILMDVVRAAYEATRRPGELLLPMSGRRACLEATAAQRAEAFLRTLSLWDDAQ